MQHRAEVVAADAGVGVVGAEGGQSEVECLLVLGAGALEVPQLGQHAAEVVSKGGGVVRAEGGQGEVECLLVLGAGLEVPQVGEHVAKVGAPGGGGGVVGAEGRQGEVEGVDEQVTGEVELALLLDVGGGAVEQPAHVFGSCVGGFRMRCGGQQVRKQALVGRPRLPVRARIGGEGGLEQVDGELGVLLLLVDRLLVSDDGLEQPVQAECVAAGLDQSVPSQRVQGVVAGQGVGGELVKWFGEQVRVLGEQRERQIVRGEVGGQVQQRDRCGGGVGQPVQGKGPGGGDGVLSVQRLPPC